MSSILLAGCSTVTSTEPATPTPPEKSDCAPDGLDLFLGKQATPELGAIMLKASGAKTLRWVAPGMMVTMDFRPDRLTVSYDAGYKILRVSCG